MVIIQEHRCSTSLKTSPTFPLSSRLFYSLLIKKKKNKNKKKNESEGRGEIRKINMRGSVTGSTLLKIPRANSSAALFSRYSVFAVDRECVGKYSPAIRSIGISISNTGSNVPRDVRFSRTETFASNPPEDRSSVYRIPAEDVITIFNRSRPIIRASFLSTSAGFAFVPRMARRPPLQVRMKVHEQACE